MKIGQTEGTDSPLGFDVDTETNLFELYHKKADPTSTAAEVEIPQPDITETIPADDKDKDKSKPTPQAEDELTQEQLDAIQNMLGKGSTGEAAADATGDNETPGDESPIAIVYDSFKEKGIIEVPEDFEFDGTEEGLNAAIQATIQHRLGNAVADEIDGAFEKHPENAAVAKDFINFIGRGGKVADFVETRRDMGFDAADLDSDDADKAKATATRMLTAYYKSIDTPEDKIQRTISRFNGDALVDEARDRWPEYQKAQETRRQQLDQQMKDQEAARIQRATEFNTQVLSLVDQSEELFGFELKTPKAKQAFKDYLTKPSVEINGKLVPKFQADRIAQMNTPEFLLSQAVNLFNGGKAVKTVDPKKVETKVASSLEARLKGLQNGQKSQAASHGAQSSSSPVTNTQKGPSIFEFDDDPITLRK